MYNHTQRTGSSYGRKRQGSHSYNSSPRRSFRGGGRGARRSQRLDVNLFVKKANAITPVSYLSENTFSNFAISDELKANIVNHNYVSPTLIQDQAIPVILEGKDVIGIANTGTGKTAAFLIPLINKAQQNRHEKILIVTPTRELAMQIIDELQIFSQGMHIDYCLCIGGASMYRQETKLRQNPQFVIGTPGRIKDLVKRNKLNLSSFHTFVLDEVDRMVDIGFIVDIKFLISLLPAQRQSLFFSATVSGKIREILQTFVKDPVTVSVKQQDTSENVDQDIVRVQDKNKKIEVLHNLLIQDGFDKVLIFGQTKWGVEKLTQALVQRGFKATAIHGNKSQGQRQRALNAFKHDEVKILLATDVASRGIDVDNITHVINYDMPESYEDYIHRIGRTGRADKKGSALTFVDR
jgi:superfamily II DNA/RNA helicase